MSEQFLFNNTNNANNENNLRVRRFIISGRQLIGLITCKRTDKDCIEFIECDLPKECSVVAASVMTAPPAVILYIHHPSFDIVPLGDEVPILPQKWQVVMLEKLPPTENGFDSYSVVDRR